MVIYTVHIKEKTTGRTLHPSYRTHLDPGEDYIKKFFGCEEPDVESYTIEREETQD